MTTRLFALLSLVLVVALSHAAPTSDVRLHVLEANVSKNIFGWFSTDPKNYKECMDDCWDEVRKWPHYREIYGGACRGKCAEKGFYPS